MARNEQDLKDRWRSAYQSSGEYHAAQRRDAIAKVQRTRQGREAMHAALLKGDSAHAADIQQSLQNEDAQPGEATEGLDAFQSKRANDYITQTEARGQLKAAEGRRGPLSGVAYGPGYYSSLENPDFSTHFPYGDIAPKVWVGMAGDAPPTSNYGRRGEPQSRAALQPPSPPDALTIDAQRRDRVQGGDRLNAMMRRERDLLSTLPANLRAHYQKLYPAQSAGGGQGLDATMSRGKFLSMTPEQQTAALHVSYGNDYARAQNGPTPPSSGAKITSNSGAPDVLSGRQSPGINLWPFAGGGGTDIHNPQYTDMPTVNPISTSRPKAQLQPDEDYLGARAGVNAASFLPSFW